VASHPARPPFTVFSPQPTPKVEDDEGDGFGYHCQEGLGCDAMVNFGPYRRRASADRSRLYISGLIGSLAQPVIEARETVCWNAGGIKIRSRRQEAVNGAGAPDTSC
jgi:hypothetical protein